MSRFTTNHSKSRSAFTPALKISVLAVGLMLTSVVDAATFTYEGGVSGSFDSTFSYGLSRRLQAPEHFAANARGPSAYRPDRSRHLQFSQHTAG